MLYYKHRVYPDPEPLLTIFGLFDQHIYLHQFTVHVVYNTIILFILWALGIFMIHKWRNYTGEVSANGINLSCFTQHLARSTLTCGHICWIPFLLQDVMQRFPKNALMFDEPYTVQTSASALASYYWKKCCCTFAQGLKRSTLGAKYLCSFKFCCITCITWLHARYCIHKKLNHGATFWTWFRGDLAFTLPNLACEFQQVSYHTHCICV